MNPKVSNPNDFKVVDFKNSTDFAFTPEMGCMYDSNPIFGTSGTSAIEPGESLKLPYHVGKVLALNLAKQVFVRKAPTIDPAGIPTGVPMWNPQTIEELQNSFLTELYVEDKPAAMSETDKLMAKVKELQEFVQANVPVKESNLEPESEVVIGEATKANPIAEIPTVYQDKAEVIAELTKRGIKFDARKNKAELEKLLA